MYAHFPRITCSHCDQPRSTEPVDVFVSHFAVFFLEFRINYTAKPMLLKRFLQENMYSEISLWEVDFVDRG